MVLEGVETCCSRLMRCSALPFQPAQPKIRRTLTFDLEHAEPIVRRATQLPKFVVPDESGRESAPVSAVWSAKTLAKSRHSSFLQLTARDETTASTYQVRRADRELSVRFFTKRLALVVVLGVITGWMSEESLRGCSESGILGFRWEAYPDGRQKS